MSNQTNEASDHFIYILCIKLRFKLFQTKTKKHFCILKKNRITLTVQNNFGIIITGEDT